MEKLRTENPEEYEKYLLKSLVDSNVKEDGVYEITPMLGANLKDIVKVAKEIARTKENIDVVKIDFNGVIILVTSTSDEKKIITDYYNSFNVRLKKQNKKIEENSSEELSR